MQHTIDLFQPSFTEEWDNFVWQANNGTIFHTRQFLNYHPPDRFEDHSLIFKKDKRVIALFPATIRNEQHRRILTSHRGASYGGLVTKFNLGIKDTFQVVESLIQYAQNNQFQGVELTPPPIVYYNRPSHYVDFALLKNGFGYRKREISSVIPLTFGEDEVLYTFSSES
ncbi:MAG: GNAT family N-acetyltransferase, partial [bacterium]